MLTIKQSVYYIEAPQDTRGGNFVRVWTDGIYIGFQHPPPSTKCFNVLYGASARHKVSNVIANKIYINVCNT